jgi:hypothetical protein
MDQNIPTLGEATVINLNAAALMATMAAFKEEERFSFVRQYDPKVQVIEGYRHAVIRYRNTDAKTVSKVAQMVTVPSIAIPDDMALVTDERLAKVIVAMLEDEQDNMIRSLIDSKQVTVIHWDSLEVSKVLDSLTAVRMSQRLTKEQIENWARIALAECTKQRALQIAAAKQLDEANTAKQVAGVLNAYVGIACKLAAPVPNVGQNEATALQNMMLTAKLDDDMAKVLLAKLHAILNPKILENEYL